jgi:BirA family biotin operon repressor/biotin-[acetyl-CoA-carboxylase] ligase
MGERVGAAETAALGHPRVHLLRTDSTNERARELAIAGAPHGTLVSAAEQTAGRGRQGRGWVAPAGKALLCSLVLREPPSLLSLIAGVALCDAVGAQARLKWPNDVVVEALGAAEPSSSPGAVPGDASWRPSPLPKPTLAKLAGILVEGRPQEGWAVLGIGLNVSVRVAQLPTGVRERAASLQLPTSAIEPLLERLLGTLARRLAEPAEVVLEAWRARDALRGREVSWARGHGRAEGIDDSGRLLVALADSTSVTLDAGEVHLESG